MSVKQNFKDLAQSFYRPSVYQRRMNDPATSFWEMILCQFIIFAVILCIVVIIGAYWLRLGEMAPIVDNFPHLTIVKGIATAEKSPVVLTSKHKYINILVDTSIGFDTALKPKYEKYNFVVTKDAFVRTDKKKEVHSFKEVDYTDIAKRDIDVAILTVVIMSPVYVTIIAPFVMIGLLIALWPFVGFCFGAGFIIALLVQPMTTKRLLLKQGVQTGLLLFYPAIALMVIKLIYFPHSGVRSTLAIFGLMILWISFTIIYQSTLKKTKKKKK